MTTDPFGNLDAIRRFLHQDILPDVAPALAGELRAAIKILGAVATELESLHPRTESECRELQQRCHELAHALGVPEQAESVLPAAAQPGAGITSTVALLRLHAELHTLMGSLIDRAQGCYPDLPAAERGLLDDVLRRCYATLGRHAACASRWQNVFEPVPVREQSPDSGL